MKPIIFLPPDLILRNLGERAKERRLEQNLSRKTLATMAGLSEETIKLFERTGHIGMERLLLLAISLGCAEDIDLLFKPRPIRSLADLRPLRRARGRR